MSETAGEKPGPPNDLARLRADRIALVILLLGALVRGLFLIETIGNGIDLRARINVDTYLYDRQARRIAAGDLAMLDRFEYSGRHPDVPGAPRESFPIQTLGVERYDREYGPYTYYDYPGYFYFVAAFYAVLGPETSAVYVAQELIDLLACALIYLIALRLFDRSVARVALALVAFSGPLICYAGFLLRDPLFASLMVGSVYFSLRAADPGRRALAWLPAGVAFGLAWITKGTVLLLLPFLLLGLVGDRAGRWRRVASGLVLFGVGAGAVLLPFAVRNVRLGVSPLKMTTLDVSSIFLYNGPNAGVRGNYFDMDAARRTAARCPRLTVLSAFRTSIAEHATPLDFFRQSARRVVNHCSADDAWDNIRVSFLTPCLPALRLAPIRWKVIEPFVVLGFVLALADPKRKGIVLGPVFLTLAMAGISVCLTRYRLHSEHFHALLAASGLVFLLREARARRARAVAIALALVAVSLALHDPVAPPTREQIAGYVLGSFPERAGRYLLANLGR